MQSLLRRAAPALPPARRHRRRRQLGRRSRRCEMFRAGAHVTMVHRAPTLKSHDQVLGAARHREPDQGRIDRGAVQRLRDRDPADVGGASVRSDGARQRDCGRRDASHAPARRSLRRRRSREEEIPADAVYLLTGYRADADLLCRAGVSAERSAGPRPRPRDLRDQRARAVRRRRRDRRRRHRHDLHRERPLPRREDHRGHCPPQLDSF